MTEDLIEVCRGSSGYQRGRCSHRFDYKPLPRQILDENKDAIIWLKKKGMPDGQIAKLSWRMVDKEKKVIIWSEITHDGEYYQEGKKHKIRYNGSPFEQIANRGKNMNNRVFYKTITRPNQIFPPADKYDEIDIQKICNKARTNSEKSLTIMNMFGKIRVAKRAD